MRLPYFVLTILLFVSILSDIYLYFVLRSTFRRKVWAIVHVAFAAIFNIAFLTVLLYPVRTTANDRLPVVMWTIYIYGSIYLPKYLYVVLDVISRVPRLFNHDPWRWLSVVGSVSATLLFVVMWWGALYNRFDLEVKEVDVCDNSLPANFEGYRIALVSDLHLGTFGDDTTFVHKIVERINALHPDIIVFSGDIVNRNSAELKPFVRTLSALKAKDGVYSVMGNHDYGDYMDWPDETTKACNLQSLKDMQKQMGWHLLNNEYTAIGRGNDSIIVVGVENIGDPPFHVYGDMHKAYSTPGDDKFKILVSHNPSHWDKEIQNIDTVNVALTMSGHTHAMQLSILGFSPIKWRYPHWGGLYADSKGQHLYVNIGAGEVGFPARIGARPEITLITLKR